ncbi:MAG: glutamine-hydrolyzing carbamoyl-phosphate synthase small subunit, partial [Terrimicrobiaceae bacterium]
MDALLALEDGTIFRGESFGAEVAQAGEICFNTSMTGYQEVLTDPSYRGQIVAMTYPLIGNYGINSLDVESRAPQVRGFVIEELSPLASNWRSQETLHDYLSRHGIPGIQGIDTRALTRRLRTSGAMRAAIVVHPTTEAEAVRLARETPYEGVDFVQEVTAADSYGWDAESRLSRRWIQASSVEKDDVERDGQGNVSEALPPATRQIVAYDFGLKTNILRSLRQNGFSVQVVPARTPPEEVLALKPEGVFLSNGPGDPAALGFAHDAVRGLIGKTPLFGICLGHQILALALGGKTFKLKFGHRGANQPVKDLRSGKVAITSQNHGYAVDPGSLPPEVEVTHINLNDGTVAGLRHRELPAFSVQYHPEASPGPHDAAYFFAEFAKEVDAAEEKV